MTLPPSSRDGDDPPPFPRALLRDIARGLLAARRALDRTLPVELIPDPVMDILLTLFASREPGVAMGNGSLAQATTVGRSVVDRYLVALDRYGLVRIDAASRQTALTDRGAAHVRAAMIAVARSQAGDGETDMARAADD